MNTHIQARRRLGFGTHGAAVSAGLLALTLGALTLGAPTTARAELAHRLDVGEPAPVTAVMDDCSLRWPCSTRAAAGLDREPQVAPPRSFDALDGDRSPGSSGRMDGTGEEGPAPLRRMHHWSYAQDGSLELRIDGVVQRHRPPPL